MTIYVIFLLTFIVGTALVAHHVGVDYGYEHGYNDAREDFLCAKCRMSDGREILDPSNNNHSIERKYQ